MAIDEKNMEVTGKMVDRVVTVEMRWGGRGDRGAIVQLYDYASQKIYGGKSISLLAAQKLIDTVKPGDNVFLVTGFASLPNMPYGEDDGPLGIASLARAVKIGLNATPVIITGERDIEALRKTVEAAEVMILDHELAKATRVASGSSITFPAYGKEGKEESRKFAAKIIKEYKPTAAISVETVGPNKAGVKHFGAGYDAEASDKLPGVEYIFTEASAKGILTIGMMDGGNEIGSGTMEAGVRQFTPWADVCRCPCGQGTACAIKTDIIYPAAVSNWGAYGVTAMVAYLLGNADILQDTLVERRMLEACANAGGVDGVYGRARMSVDGIEYFTGEAMLTMLHGVIRSALKGAKIEGFGKK